MALTVASQPEAVSPTGPERTSPPPGPTLEASLSNHAKYAESDWLHYFESPVVEEDYLYLVAEEYARENLAGAVSCREDGLGKKTRPAKMSL